MPRDLSPELRRISSQAHRWVVLLEESQVSAETKAEFDAWLEQGPSHKDAFDHARMSVAASQTLQVSDFPDLKSTPKYLLLRSYAIEAIDFFKEKKGLLLGLGGAVAASLAITLFLKTPQTAIVPAAPNPAIATYESAVGELKTISLADGTQVTLGGRSSIETEFYPDKRLVMLQQGKAYFDVAPDPQRPLSVIAADLTATAVGTAFDVQRNGEAFRVGVTEGRVDVEYPLIIDGNDMGITTARPVSAGQEIAATTENGLEQVTNTNKRFLAAWRSGKLVYRSVSIAELIVDLNRYSERPITIDPESPEIRSLQFGGNFPDKNINEVLEMLAEIHPIEVDTSSTERTVLRKKTPS